MNDYINELNFKKLTLIDMVYGGAKIINNVYSRVQTPEHIRIFESILIRINDAIVGATYTWAIDRNYYALAEKLMRYSHYHQEANMRQRYAELPDLEAHIVVGKYRAITMRIFVSIMGRYCRINNRFMKLDLFAELPSLTTSHIVQIINYFATYTHVVRRIDLLRRIRSQFHEMFLIPVKKLANYADAMVDEISYADVNNISLYVIIIVLLIRYRRCSRLSDSDCSLITSITAEAFGQFDEHVIASMLQRDRKIYHDMHRKNTSDVVTSVNRRCRYLWHIKRYYCETIYSIEHDKLMLSIMLGSSAGIVAMLIRL